MNTTLERPRLEHRHLDRLIDNCRNVLRQDEMKAFKRRRPQLKDRIANLQCRMGQSRA